MSEYDTIRNALKRIESLSPTGFAIAFHIRFTAPDFLLQTYPEGWIDIYSERGYVMSDPTVHWGFNNTGVVRWSDLKDNDPAGIFPEAARHGLRYGVSIATETGGSRSFSSFARADREFTETEVETLTALLEELHHATASENGMSAGLRDELHRQSVAMTHPRTGKP
ncbi:MAG: LuxR family transcriptional regulator [Rhodobacteraceae bacterium HLUCCA08]|nr:MAG: LuxR family transcriptional regulator [Rhodobacteraceae bacterium HLUCCA08]